jgi:flagellar motor switch protein FliG
MDDELTIDEAPTAPLDGASAAAILLMLLSEDEAAAILSHFDPQEVRSIGTAMFAAASASEAQIECALDRFIDGSRAISSLSVGAEPRIRKVMTGALGNIRANNLLSEIAPQSSAAALDILRWMDVASIAQIIASEHPQVGAIIISVLTPDVAAAVLESSDEATQSDLLLRAARLGSVPAAAIADLESILARADEPARGGVNHRIGGTTDTAKIVNSMGKPLGERILKSLKKADKVLGMTIEDEMFIFDNLIELDSMALGTVLRSVDAAALTLALKGASAALVDKMLGSMSARAAQAIRDDIADSGLVKRSEVEEAQRAVVGVARRLADEGTIMLGAKGNDYV